MICICTNRKPGEDHDDPCLTRRVGIHKALGDVGNQKGRQLEEKLFNLIINSEKPEWMTGPYKLSDKNDEDDRNGIDITVGTDVGKIFVQVKSSRHKDLEKYRKKNIVVMVGSLRENETILWNRLRSLIADKRNSFLAKRK